MKRGVSLAITIKFYGALTNSLFSKKHKQFFSSKDTTKICVSWVFFGRNHAKAETPVLWPPHAKSWLIGKDSDAGRDWGQEEKGMTEDEMAGWHRQLDGCESEWTPGIGDGQGSLACCNSWSRKESDTTEWLNWTERLKMQVQWFLCSHLTQLFGLCRGDIVLAASTEKYPSAILLFSFILRPTILRNLVIRSSWSEPQSAPGLVFVDCIELLHLWLQRI